MTSPGARNGSWRSRVAKATLLGLLLGLHFFTRLHAQQVTPLQERHFYPLSYLVSFSLLEGRGFGYLLPANASVETVWGKAVPPPGDPASPVLGFVRLAGHESVSRQELAAYRAAGTRVVEADPVETTRILDIHVAAWLWRVFGVSWSVYFLFYSLLSTATAFCVFFVVRRATDSYWFGLAAAAGFLASPLEQYSSVWSTRDTVPLWFTALAFGALAAFSGVGRTTRATLAGAFGVGAGSLIGLGWRPDFQLVPPLVLAGLVATLVAQRRPWRQTAWAIVAFAAGCAAVLLLLRLLGAGTYSQGGTVFHTAWYGEASRSNLLQTENAFQVARDDQLTLYQANFFGAARFSRGAEGTPSRATKDLRHYSRCRAMYVELARYQAFNWWAAFPAFMARNAGLDRPTLLASEQALAAFRDRRPGWMKSLYVWLDRYGSLLPWLMLVGLVGGLLDERSRVTTALMAAYFACYAAVVLLVLPEAKHTIPLLLPVHVLAAVGLWCVARVLAAWRRLPRLAWESRRRLAILALTGAVLGLAWGALGAGAFAVSRQQRARIIDSVRRTVDATSMPAEALDSKLFSSSVEADATPARFGYLLLVRASRPANLLCLHVRGRTSQDGFHAYYTRHPIEPGADRLFFFNVVAGAELGDPRPYTAHVRLVGPARVVSSRRVDLDQWPLGLPLSVVFDEDDRRPGGTVVGPGGAATEGLSAPSEVRHLLEEPGAFLVSYRPQ